MQVFILCHEGEVPYVVRGLQDALQDDSTMQIVSQGSTEKMYMGYVLLAGDGDPPVACLAELRANPDVYLYAIHNSDAQDMDENAGLTEPEECEAPGRASELMPIEL